MNSTDIVIEGLSLQIAGQRVLNNIHSRIPAGRISVLLGANGAGKSSLLRTLSGEQTFSSGQISLGARNLQELQKNPRQLAQHRAVMNQFHPLNFGLTVEQVVMLGRQCWARECTQAENQAQCQAAIEACQLQELQARRYTRLSGGQKARVQFARALAQILGGSGDSLHGRWLLLDEPTANLDLGAQQDLMRLLRSLSRTGLGIIMVVHDLNLAALVADHALLLKNGELLAEGCPEALASRGVLQQAFNVDLDIQPRNGGGVLLNIGLEEAREPRTAR